MNIINEMVNGVRCVCCGAIIPEDEQTGEPQKCKWCIEEDEGEPI